MTLSVNKKIDNKIKTPQEIKQILNSQNKTSIMCHGNFDLVHPGHIRHLLYAKSKADILIVSITADNFINKIKKNSIIPENLRAQNLAALEMVDFVFVDFNETPIKNLKIIKPNFFIKGYEYQDKKNFNTAQEINIVKKYGGEVIFSPGDVVFSSTILKTKLETRLFLEKIKNILLSQNTNLLKISNLLKTMPKIKIHIVGDTIVDVYHDCILLGQTNKTPTFSIKKNSSKEYMGGAAIVAKHFRNLGVDVTFTTVVGDDKYKKKILADLKLNNIKTNIIVDKIRPTTVKERFWVENNKLLQVDTVDNVIISDEKVDLICKYLKKKCDLLVFSDFRHGIFNSSTIKKYLNVIKKTKTIKVADSQVSNRWGNILDFKNFDIIFPNEKEARFSLGDQDSPVRPLGEKLLKYSKSKNVVLKLGEKGLMCFKKSGLRPRDFYSIDSFSENAVDTVGTGDALLASTSLLYFFSGNIVISALIGSISAAVECSRKGNVPISKIEILNFIKKIDEQLTRI
jgi:rfaE bifunctional protein kinase chain/domain